MAPFLRLEWVVGDGVQPYLYLERMSQDIVESLGLSAKGAHQQADIYVRIPGNRESVFRGAVVKGGVPSSDISASVAGCLAASFTGKRTGRPDLETGSRACF
jgi:hypothetical protein